MFRTEVMTYSHPYWAKTADFADRCSWRAGRLLARKMRENDFGSNERVIAALCGDEIAGFCTFADKDELPPEYDYTPFAGFVFVSEKYRGRRLSGMLLDTACGIARDRGFPFMYVMSGEKGLYEKYGFTKLGDFGTVYGTVDQLFRKRLGAE